MHVREWVDDSQIAARPEAVPRFREQLLWKLPIAEYLCSLGELLNIEQEMSWKTSDTRCKFNSLANTQMS